MTHFFRALFVLDTELLHLFRDVVEKRPHFIGIQAAQGALLELMALDMRIS